MYMSWIVLPTSKIKNTITLTTYARVQDVIINIDIRGVGCS